VNDVRAVLNGLGGIVFFLGFLPYIAAILRRQTRPSKASWVIWSTLNAVTLASMWQAGTVNGQIVSSVLGAATVAVLSLFYGDPDWTRLDAFSLAGALLGAVLGVVLRNPSVTIVCTVTVMFLGAIPTFRTGWREPEKENAAAWTLYFVSCVLTLCSISEWTLNSAAAPLMFTVIASTMTFLVWRPRARLHPVEV
jgi:hypothetical protein